MPHRRFDWHEHLKEVEGEYRAAQFAMDRLRAQLAADPSVLGKAEAIRASLPTACTHLEGTYLIRLFAAFEAALRSYDRAKNHDPTRQMDAAVLIDSIGGRRGQGISTSVRADAQMVRRVRNRWAHEDDNCEDQISLKKAAAHLQTFLSWLPETWASFD